MSGWFEFPAPLTTCRSILEQHTDPQIAPDEQPLPSVCECECEWVNVVSAGKCFAQSVDWKSAIEIQVHLPTRKCISQNVNFWLLG